MKISGKLEKFKSWEPFLICLLNITANPAIIYQSWARLAVQINSQNQNRGIRFWDTITFSLSWKLLRPKALALVFGAFFRPQVPNVALSFIEILKPITTLSTLCSKIWKHLITQYPFIRTGDQQSLVGFLINPPISDIQRFLIFQLWPVTVS